MIATNNPKRARVFQNPARGSQPATTEFVIRFEVIELIPGIVDAIKATAQTGKIGDGKIFVYDIASAVRIRTGEADKDAL